MGWIRKARALFRREALSAELEEELRFHVAMREELNMVEGMPPALARADAQQRLGNATLLKEKMREADLFTFAESVARDLRFAARMLAKHPGFTFLAVLALSAGIGINTAVFTAYKAFLLRPLDGAHPEELFNIYHSRPDQAYDPIVSYADYEGLRDNDRSFSGILAVTGDELTMTDAGAAPDAAPSLGSSVLSALGFRLPTTMSGAAEPVTAALVSDNFFSVLGVAAIRGRVFTARDAAELMERPQLLISENYWERRFGHDKSILGRTVKLNSRAFVIAGVTPRDFMGTFTTQVPDFWMPLRLEPLVHRNSDLLTNREKPCCTVIGRLAPGVTPARAQAETEALANRLLSLHAPGTEGSRPLTIQVAPGSPFQRPQQDPKLKLIVAVTLGAVGLVLLIACANVAGMQLARSAARQREIGVRLSIGASRARVVRQLLTESALLGMTAGSLALILSFWTLRILVVEAAAAMPIEWGTFALHIHPDGAVFAYVFGISLLASVLFGLAPALESSRPDLVSALKEEGMRFRLPVGNRGLRNTLMAVQVGICLFLMVMASLLIRSSSRTLDLRTGYEGRQVLQVNLSFPATLNYPPAKQTAEVNLIRRKLMALPGVTGVTLGRSPDGGGLRTAKILPAGRVIFYTFVLPNYFETLDIPLVAGHVFSVGGSDRLLVSQSAAKRLWPGEDPVGRTVTLDVSDQFHVEGELTPASHPYVVAGVVGDTRGVLLDGSDSDKIYLPLLDSQFAEQPILVRTHDDPRRLFHAIGGKLHAIDPNLIAGAMTLDDALRNTPSFVIARCSGLFATVIGLLGLLLASAGIYGSVSYAVVRRTREVGIRVALGATRHDILRQMVSETARPVTVGLLVGLVAAAIAARLVRAILGGLSGLDPISFGGVSLFLLAIAMLAAFLPARRALRIEPMAALRCE